jgi:hypothetical protein
MDSSDKYLCGLVILSVFFAFSFSLGAAVAADTPLATVSIGTDIAKIISVNYQGKDQWVEIANQGTGSMNLTGWTLMNAENQTYSFPDNFVLKAGTTVRVHTATGDNTDFDLFNSTLIWNEEGDAATLMEAAGRIISEYKYPITVSAPESATKSEPLMLQDTSSIVGPLQPFLPDYRSDYGAKVGSSKSSTPVNLTGHAFICHGGPLNWAWTSGL